jgi:phosphoribosylamine--glycine ligase
MIVGSGGREHAIAWKISQSPRLSKLFIAPGNGGTALLGENVLIGSEDIPALVEFARKEKIDLVLIGPEAALAAGLVDEMNTVGIRSFGPTKAAAEIESSKKFAKNFMLRHGIPTARFSSHTDFGEACNYLSRIDYPVVIKAAGLAGGKGVLLPYTQDEARNALKELIVEHSLGKAGDEVIIEERLDGEEVSLLAFCDGYTVYPMPPAQDHKRLLDMDRGPNTGGMGAYAPAPVCPPELVDQILGKVLQPAIDGLREEGRPYIGVLYAGLMLTKVGMKVLEFNCRFGDPETQVVLPRLAGDLLPALRACALGGLDETMLAWKPQACATVVMASGGYPGAYPKGKPIEGLDRAAALPDVQVFHAGTRLENGRVVTAGGRVLNVTASAPTLAAAVRRAYEAVGCIRFEGAQYRKDIAARALGPR